MVDTTVVAVLSFLVFLPVLGSIVVALIPSDQKEAIRWTTLGTTVLVLAISVLFLLMPGKDTSFDASLGAMQTTFNLPWIPSFDIEYFFGMDGISFPLVMLTTLVSAFAMGASWSIDKYVKGYCILFLLLLTGMLGVFLALDFFLFYVFWEVMLLPMYFLIGVWGGPRKEYAAIKFFLYTLGGSVLMLIAILMLYFSSDLRVVADKAFDGSLNVAWEDLHVGPGPSEKLGIKTTSQFSFMRIDDGTSSKPLAINFVEGKDVSAAYDVATNAVNISVRTEGAPTTAAEVVSAVGGSDALAKVVMVRAANNDAVPAGETVKLAAYDPVQPIHTFNILALAAIGQNTDLFDARYGFKLFGMEIAASLQMWAFWLLFIGFIIKVPSVPFHTWLPDAHVEAPTPISMILAGVLLKMGGYGIIRICYPICPDGGYESAYVVCLLGVVSMVYGGFAALAQKDFKRMVAYSSVSHMGYVVLGLGVWSATAGTNWDPQYWIMGVKGAMFQMIGHGISSPGMFFMVGIVYDRVHHRNLEEFGGIFGKMPVYTAMAMGLFFAGLGLPGLCGFIGEVFVVLSVWMYSPVLAIISAAVVIITAAYILWAIQRVYLGAEYRGPHEEALTPSTLRENFIGMSLLFLSILFGVYPNLILSYMDKSIDRQVELLADWTRENKDGEAVATSPPTVSNNTISPTLDAPSLSIVDESIQR